MSKDDFSTFYCIYEHVFLGFIIKRNSLSLNEVDLQLSNGDGAIHYDHNVVPLQMSLQRGENLDDAAHFQPALLLKQPSRLHVTQHSRGTDKLRSCRSKTGSRQHSCPIPTISYLDQTSQLDTGRPRRHGGHRPANLTMPTSAAEAPTSTAAETAPATSRHIVALPPFNPDLHERAWASTPHPTLPLLATAHGKSVTVFSLSTLSSHSSLTGGHTRSVRSASWKPNLPPHRLCLVTGSFDSTAGVWRWEDDGGDGRAANEREITSGGDADSEGGEQDWEFTLVLEGHDSELKSCAFSPAGAYLATCSRDKSVWIWEDIGATEADDEWETIAVLNEHEGDVKALAWCPDVPGRSRRGTYGVDVLASASYDDTVRVWREDGDAEWVCVAVLEGHAGTVWGVQWEGRPRVGDKFPRLLTYSADKTLRIWTLDQSQDDDEGGEPGSGAPRPALGGIPNTMRQSLREEWKCTATLPKVHGSDVYSAAWSPTTGLVASTGSDGVLALYQEVGETGEWTVVETQANAHGPYEVNHVTWCKRWDAGVASDKRGVEEMLVTTGDDGIVRPWQVIAP